MSAPDTRGGVDPGEGFRLLEEGEIRQRGDEAFLGWHARLSGQREAAWQPVSPGFVGKPWHTKTCVPVRRRLPAPCPAPASSALECLQSLRHGLTQARLCPDSELRECVAILEGQVNEALYRLEHEALPATGDAADRAAHQIALIYSDVWREQPAIAAIIRAEFAVQEERVRELEAVLRKIIAHAPTEKPEWYEGDNHSDTASNASNITHWSLAEVARLALAPTGKEDRP